MSIYESGQNFLGFRVRFFIASKPLAWHRRNSAKVWKRTEYGQVNIFIFLLNGLLLISLELMYDIKADCFQLSEPDLGLKPASYRRKHQFSESTVFKGQSGRQHTCDAGTEILEQIECGLVRA